MIKRLSRREKEIKCELFKAGLGTGLVLAMRVCYASLREEECEIGMAGVCPEWLGR